MHEAEKMTKDSGKRHKRISGNPGRANSIFPGQSSPILLSEQTEREFTLIAVNNWTFHPAQRGVDLYSAEECTYPEWEPRKPDQFACSEFLDKFKLWLKLLDVL